MEFDDWRQREHWWAGAIVVLRGDLVGLESCTFRVRHPAITTSMKSPFLLGGYERAERDILKQYLNPAIGVVELGGSVGVIACLTNKMLRNPQTHVVVEANPDLIGLLKDNRDRNGCTFAILNRAVAYGSDEVSFYQDAGCFLAGSVHVRTATSVTVPTTSLRRIIRDYAIETCTLICDIEGGEMDLVRHESDVLEKHVEMVIVEIHGWLLGMNLVQEMNDTFERIGFRCLHEKGATRVFRNMALATETRTVVDERKSGLASTRQT
jgi:FkbM family methyltransferase